MRPPSLASTAMETGVCVCLFVCVKVFSSRPLAQGGKMKDCEKADTFDVLQKERMRIDAVSKSKS